MPNRLRAFFEGSRSGRSRGGLLLVLLVSALLHAVLLGWLAGDLSLSGAATSARPIDVALIGGEAVGSIQASAPSAPATVAEPAPRPKPAAARRPSPRPIAGPNAITPQAERDERDRRAAEERQATVERAIAQAERADPFARPDGASPVPGADEAPPDDGPADKEEARVAAEEAPPASADAPETAAGDSRGPLFGTALPAPAVGQWKFRVYYGDFAAGYPVASLDYAIELDGERYRMRTEGRAEGLTALIYSGVLTQSSRGRIGDNGMVPEHYSEQRGKRAERQATVDWERAEVRFSGSDSRATPVPGMQDRLSALVQLGLIARAAPERFDSGQDIEIPELSMKGVSTTRYRSYGAQVLETPDGTLRTYHLERVEPRPGREPRIEIWLGRDHQLLPVRIRITDDRGRVLDQLLER